MTQSTHLPEITVMQLNQAVELLEGIQTKVVAITPLAALIQHYIKLQLHLLAEKQQHPAQHEIKMLAVFELDRLKKEIELRRHANESEE